MIEKKAIAFEPILTSTFTRDIGLSLSFTVAHKGHYAVSHNISRKSDRINSDRHECVTNEPQRTSAGRLGSDQLGSTRTNSDRIENNNKIKLDSDQLGS